MRGLDQALAADVREIGDRQHVHNAPGMIGGIAVKLAADRCSHDAARTVAAYDISGLDRLGLALVPGVKPFEGDRN